LGKSSPQPSFPLPCSAIPELDQSELTAEFGFSNPEKITKKLTQIEKGLKKSVTTEVFDPTPQKFKSIG
jgi:hypothetical protein